MKNKKKKTGKMLLIAIIAFAVSSELFAQGNSNGLWQAKGADTVTTNREVLINKNLKVQKNIIADTVIGRIIKAGNNSLYIGGQITGTSDDITSTNPAITFGRDPITVLPFSDISIGIGTTIPQSKLHLYDDNVVYEQFTNIATVSAVTDGFKVGIDATGTAELKQQEDQDIRLFTGDVGMGLNLERMRISIGTIFPLSWNVPNVNRISVGEIGAVTSPKSLIHLGFDLPVSTSVAWRDWMDLGIFGNTTYSGSGGQTMFMGFKNEDPTASNPWFNKMDVVINWGHNSDSYSPRLRYIFTSSFPTQPAGTTDGLEVMRIYSNGTRGFVGIGDNPSPNNKYLNNTSADPTQTLEINSIANTIGPTNSGLRFSDLDNTANPLPPNLNGGVLSVNNLGDVIYVEGGAGTVNAANNGTSLDPLNSTVVQLGNDIGLTTAQLLNDREIPMNNKDIIFTFGNNTAKNRIGIGMLETDLSPEIKLEVRGSISIYDGIPGSNNNGNNSLFFGREQTTLAGQLAYDFGEWGIQYTSPNTIGNTLGGLNFWKPSGSDGSGIGNGFGNAYLYLSNNGNIGVRTPDPQFEVDICSQGLLYGNTLPRVFTTGNAAVGWQFDAISSGGHNWILHSTGTGNASYQGIGKFVFHILDDSTDVMTMTPPTSAHMPNPDARVGIQTNYPQNTLEINSPAPNPNTLNNCSVTSTGFSGLRFTDLTSGSIPCSPPPTTNVLSVDDDGDVILVQGGTGTVNAANNGTSLDPGNSQVVQLGNLANVGSTTAKLLNDREVPLNDFNITFTNGPLGTLGKNNFGIGTPVPSAKFEVDNFIENFTAKFISNSEGAYSGSNVYGVYSITSGGSTGARNTGIWGEATSTNADINVGVMGVANLSSNKNMAGWFVVDNQSAILSNINYGVLSSAKDANINYGVYSAAQSGSLNYGIYSSVQTTNPSDWAGWFYGNISGIGNIVLSGINYTYSDSSIKKNITSIHGALNILNALNPHQFDFKTDDFPQLNLPANNQYGLISQEVEGVLPELVANVTHPAQYDTLDNEISPELSFKTLNYNGFIPILIQGVKELDSSVTVLQNTTPPNKPILAFPADSATAIPLTITLTWEKSERAASYTVYVNPRGVIGRDVIEESIVINTADTFATLTLHNYFSSYNWYVVAYNSAGSSDLSDQWSFTTLMPPFPSAVTLVSPINSATGLPLANTFIWNKSEFANNYTLYVSTDMSYANVVNIVNARDTFANATVPNYSTKYFWWVIASNVSGQSPESAKWEFATLVPPPPPLPPVLISPANGDTLMGLKGIAFTWHKSEAAPSYSFYLSLTPDETGLVYNNTSVDTFNIVQFLSIDTTYYWWVSACNQYSCGNKSDVWNFYNQTSMTPKEEKSSEATLSDSTLKTDVSTLSNAIGLITQMQAVKFYWDTINNAWLPATEQIGLVGQQIENIVPQVVFKDSAGYYNIQYGRLVALLVEGMKEQQLQIDSLKTIVMGTNNKSTGDNGNNDSQSNMQYVELITENAIILNQNDPNPFAEETDITYTLPDDVSEAKIIFYDNTGKIVKTVELIGRGDGSLHVYASNLSSGIYAYTLIADGNVIDTKKMVCSKK